MVKGLPDGRDASIVSNKVKESGLANNTAGYTAYKLGMIK
jgi:hypothetical protein